MKKAPYVFIGGGHASAHAAETMRKEGATGKIIIIAEENFLPYFRPQLPSDFLLGKRKKESLLIFDENFYKQNDIEVLLNTKAIAVDAKKKIVTTDHAGEIQYKKLLIASGCAPQKIDVPGCKLEGINYIGDLTDAEGIIKDKEGAKNAVILGGSFIGLEMASSLKSMGINVTIITQQFLIFNLKPTDELCKFLEKNNVNVMVPDGIKKFNGSKRVESIETTSGKTLPCDLVIIVQERKPQTDFLEGSGIKVDDGVLVNQYMQTNKPSVYAVGDVARFYNPVFDKIQRVEGWDNAGKQAKIAALNMLGDRKCYRTTPYFFFNAFGNAFVMIGDGSDFKERIVRGSNTTGNFAVLFLKDDYLQCAFFSGRPISEIKAAESLIVNHISLAPYKKDICSLDFSLEAIATQTLLTLQGGGALGAFECGVIKAMEEQKVYPDIVAGISIGAFNSAIIASHPRNATEALEAFWNELAVDTPDLPDEQVRRFISSWQSIVWGNPHFFQPRWLMMMNQFNPFAFNNWTSLYDPSHMKEVLCKYVDFKNLKNSPVRLLVMAVNVETSEFETFDSYTDDITPEHIFASGSLPPALPWTTIKGKHYWDGGIVTNTPLDSALEISGPTSKKVFIVELYPRKRTLPKNMVEVLTRKDEILYAEKIRKNISEREQINTYRKLISVMLRFSEPGVAEEIKQLPMYIQAMGDPGLNSITRIVRETNKDEPYSWDSDFSRITIEDHKLKGYEATKKALKKVLKK